MSGLRFIAQFETSSWQITTSGGGLCTVADGWYVLTDSKVVAGNFLSALDTATGWAWQMRTDGRVTVGTGGATGTWTDTRLRDALGFTGTSIANNAVADHASPFRLDLAASAEEDLEAPEAQSSVTRSDNREWIDNWGTGRNWRTLDMFLTGSPRGGVSDAEYWRARRFWQSAVSQGLSFRYFADVAQEAVAAFDATNEPWGYQVYVCDTLNWPFQPIAKANHNYWRGQVKLHPSTEN